MPFLPGRVSRPFAAGALLAAAAVFGAAPSAAGQRLAGVGSGSNEAGEGSADESRFLSRVRRLTVEGRRAGEGYFSPDGREIVFQSEREPGNPFFQIYLLSFETGETLRVSPGTGKTTCAFISPSDGGVLFASTHLDPRSVELQREEIEFRESGRERRYSWDYDPAMDLFAWDRDSGELTRLTEARGYDAEASYSPDGEWIAFTSMRSLFEDELTERERRLAEVDPSYFGEIWIMRADGSGKTRLTNAPGYDGGPFFFPDGERIVWRRFSEDGVIADIYSMRRDGSDLRRLTDFRSMSWAPYVHPSGEYLLFASNKLGFSNFEVYLVDTAGEKEPIRVTTTDGFDGLPVPTPDGRGLAWTSTRHGEGSGGQIYLADWNHEEALAALVAAPARRSASETPHEPRSGNGIVRRLGMDRMPREPSGEHE